MTKYWLKLSSYKIVRITNNVLEYKNIYPVQRTHDSDYK